MNRQEANGLREEVRGRASLKGFAAVVVRHGNGSAVAFIVKDETAPTYTATSLEEAMRFLSGQGWQIDPMARLAANIDRFYAKIDADAADAKASFLAEVERDGIEAAIRWKAENALPVEKMTALAKTFRKNHPWAEVTEDRINRMREEVEEQREACSQWILRNKPWQANGNGFHPLLCGLEADGAVKWIERLTELRFYLDHAQTMIRQEAVDQATYPAL